jgi:hypothetical protein
MPALLRTLVALLLTAAAASARADDLVVFNRAVEAAAAHSRVAIGYLRTGNVDLAGMELDRLRAAWTKVTPLARPAELEQSAYVTAMTDVAMRLVTADMMLNSGRPDQARDALLGARDDLYRLRTTAHVPVLADCIRDANEAMDRLMVFNGRPPEPAAQKAAAAYGMALTRCDRMAGEKVHADPEFRRLVDGAEASLGKIPAAVTTKDEDLLHRLLIELRSFDNLLAFRYG